MLLSCLEIQLWGAPDSLDGVRGCRRQMGGLLEEAALYFGRKGCSVFFCTERAVHISVDCYDPARAWHLEFEICVVRHRIEFYECGSSEQGLIATVKRDYIED